MMRMSVNQFVEKGLDFRSCWSIWCLTTESFCPADLDFEKHFWNEGVRYLREDKKKKKASEALLSGSFLLMSQFSD